VILRLSDKLTTTFSAQIFLFAIVDVSIFDGALTRAVGAVFHPFILPSLSLLD
jgi:hypothetical protein